MLCNVTTLSPPDLEAVVRIAKRHGASQISICEGATAVRIGVTIGTKDFYSNWVDNWTEAVADLAEYLADREWGLASLERLGL